MKNTICDNRKELIEKCTNCKACVFSCPKNAISMYTEKNGYNYPKVDKDKCINCGKCIKTCYALSSKKELIYSQYSYLGQYLSKHINPRSSSGGFVSDLIQIFIRNGGIVYTSLLTGRTLRCCRFDSIENLNLLGGSVYTKSDFSFCFENISKDLKENKKILVVGMPCDLAGVNAVFSSSNIYYCALCCGGCISEKYFEIYINYLERKYKKEIKYYNFRCKKYYPVSYCSEVTFMDGKTKILNGLNLSYTSIMNSEYVRPSCLNCSLIETKTFDFLVGDNHLFGFDSPSNIFALSKKGADFLKDLNSSGYVIKVHQKNENNLLKSFVYRKTGNFIFSFEKQSCFYNEINRDYIKAIRKYIFSKNSLKNRIYTISPYFIKKAYCKVLRHE